MTIYLMGTRSHCQYQTSKVSRGALTLTIEGNLAGNYVIHLFLVHKHLITIMRKILKEHYRKERNKTLL